ncbi:MAG: hypothetical protein RID91_03940 [Azospirillaceae bacterium]
MSRGPRRLLVHAMQASGASAVTAWLAQRPDCLALVDVPLTHVTPRIASDRPAIAKAVITTAYSLAEHAARFEADARILVVRDPRAIHASLSRRPYRDDNGLMEEKLAALDAAFAEGRRAYDLVVAFEDVLADRAVAAEAVRAIGWPVEDGHDDFPRGPEAMLADLRATAPDLFARFPLGFGDWRPGGFDETRSTPSRLPEAEAARLAELCPTLTDHYRARAASAAGGRPMAAAGAAPAPS